MPYRDITEEVFMAIDERELYFAHTLDVAWIIALWHWIHGGDPVRDGVTAQTTELMARALVGHLSDRKAEVPKDIIEKLGQLGIKVTVKLGDQQTEIKTTKEFHDRMTQKQGENRPIPCMSIINGRPVCWSPIWELFPLGRLRP
jgi:hypothetical protein